MSSDAGLRLKFHYVLISLLLYMLTGILACGICAAVYYAVKHSLKLLARYFEIVLQLGQVGSWVITLPQFHLWPIVYC